MKRSAIVGITIGFFQEKEDRDKAFNEYVLPNSNNCVTGFIENKTELMENENIRNEQ